MSLIAVAKRVPGTRLEFFAEIRPTDWKPLVACGDAPRGVWQGVTVVALNAGHMAKVDFEIDFADGDPVADVVADPDARWEGNMPAAVMDEVTPGEVYAAVMGLLSELARKAEPSARAAIDQQKKGA